jgi:hypothetical protein
MTREQREFLRKQIDAQVRERMERARRAQARARARARTHEAGSVASPVVRKAPERPTLEQSVSLTARAEVNRSVRALRARPFPPQTERGYGGPQLPVPRSSTTAMVTSSPSEPKPADLDPNAPSSAVVLDDCDVLSGLIRERVRERSGADAVRYVATL